MQKKLVVGFVLCGALLALQDARAAQVARRPMAPQRRRVVARPRPAAKQQLAAKPTATPSGKAITGEIDQLIAGAVKKAHDKLQALKDLLTKEQINRILGDLNYRTTEKISLVTSQGDGFVFSFGYTGHGDVSTGYDGIQPSVSLGDLPDFIQEPFKAAFKKLGFEKLLASNPAREWAFKVTLLIKDLAKKKIGPSTFVNEFNLLLVRLIRTTQNGALRYPTFAAVLDDVSHLVKQLLESTSAPISDELFFDGGPLGASKPLIGFLESYYARLKAIATIQFSCVLKGGDLIEAPGYQIPDETLSAREAGERLMGLRLAAFSFYHSLNDAFAKTEAGKKAFFAKEGAIKLAASMPRLKKVLAKNKAVLAYNKAIPGFSDLRNFVTIELANLFDRIEDQRFKNLIAKIVNPALFMLGLPSFNQLLTSIGKKPEDLPPPPPPATAQPERYDESNLEEQLLDDEPIL